MKLSGRASLILILIFSLVCSPALAVINQDNPLASEIQQNAKREGVLIGQATKKPKGLLQRFGLKRRSRTKKKRQGLFGIRRQQRKPKVQQKQKRQGFLSRFRFRRNRKNAAKKQALLFYHVTEPKSS
jgi:hypothetical protein